jgi:hypothetical protein
LPEVAGIGEGFLDFRYIHRVTKQEIEAALAAGRRVASMTDDGRTALLAYLYRFFSRQTDPPDDPPEIARDQG